MAEQTEAPPYLFNRGRRAILAEVLFPKRVEYQSPIYLALQAGLDQSVVREYLKFHVADIMREMGSYPKLFDPDQYQWARCPDSVSVPAAERRMDMYKSHFEGWSMYEVDGTYLDSRANVLHLPINQRLIQDRTQAIRLIFKMESEFEAESKSLECYDVLEALMRWVMSERGRLDHVVPWSYAEKERFITLHSPWPRHKREFLDRRYTAIAREVKQWIDDTGLFVFGFLVRSFWSEIKALGHSEDEIWVINLFNVNLNVVKEMPVTVITEAA